MKKTNLKKYTDFLVKETETLLNIDSPTGYTEDAAAWVKSEFEKLGFEAKLTNKGGVIVSFGGNGLRHGLIGAGVYASHGYERSHRDGAESTLRLLVAHAL